MGGLQLCVVVYFRGGGPCTAALFKDQGECRARLAIARMFQGCTERLPEARETAAPPGPVL